MMWINPYTLLIGVCTVRSGHCGANDKL